MSSEHKLEKPWHLEKNQQYFSGTMLFSCYLTSLLSVQMCTLSSFCSSYMLPSQISDKSAMDIAPLGGGQYFVIALPWSLSQLVTPESLSQ